MSNTPVSETATKDSAALVKAQIRKAVQLWRLAAAIEFQLPYSGRHLSVGDVLAVAGMSRRTFYELFRDLDDALIFVVERGRAYAQGGPVRVPRIEFFTPALAVGKDGRLTVEDWSPADALAQWNEASSLAVPRPVPEDKGELIRWAGLLGPEAQAPAEVNPQLEASACPA